MGYLVAASLNSRIHAKVGQRGVAVIASTCHVIQALVFSAHPPYPVILVAFIFSGFGLGLVDAAWSAWASELHKPNTAQGFLHGSFSIGCTFGPFIAISMFTKANLPWYTYYYVLVCYTPKTCFSETDPDVKSGNYTGRRLTTRARNPNTRLSARRWTQVPLQTLARSGPSK